MNDFREFPYHRKSFHRSLFDLIWLSRKISRKKPIWPMTSYVMCRFGQQIQIVFHITCSITTILHFLYIYKIRLDDRIISGKKHCRHSRIIFFFPKFTWSRWTWNPDDEGLISFAIHRSFLKFQHLDWASFTYLLLDLRFSLLNMSRNNISIKFTLFYLKPIHFKDAIKTNPPCKRQIGTL